MNAYKTIFSRITKASATEGTLDKDISKAESALRGINVEVRDSASEFRDLSDIMRDIGAVWDSLTSVQKSNVGFEVAGTRQLNILNSLFGSWKEYESIMANIDDRTGMTIKNQGTYADSLKGHLGELTATGESIWTNLLNSEGLKDGVDTLNGLLTIIDKLTSSFGLLGTAGLIGGGILGTKTNSLDLARYNTETKSIEWLAGFRKKIPEISEEVSNFFDLLEKDVEFKISDDQTFLDLADGIKNTDQNFLNFLETTQKSGTVYANSTDALAGYQAYLKSTTKSLSLANLGTKALTFSMKAVSIAANMALSLGIGLVIQGIVSGIDYLIHRSEKIIEKGQEASKTIEILNSDFQSHKKTVADIGGKYEELSKGVDKFNNSNKTLTTADYEEFLDISNQLAEMFPSLVKGYDENGNALLNFGSDAQSVTSHLQELLKTEQDLANFKISENLQDVFNGVYEEVKKAQVEIDALELKAEKAKSVSELFSNNNLLNNSFGKTSFRIDSSIPEAAEISMAVQKELQKLGKTSDSYIGQSGEYDKQGNPIAMRFLSFSELSDKELNDIKESLSLQYSNLLDVADDVFASSSKYAAEKKKDMDGLWKQVIPSITSSLETSESFNGLSAEIQSGIRLAINNVNYSELSKEEQEDIMGFIKDAFVYPISSAKPEIQEVYSSLFQLNLDDSINVDDYSKKVDNLIAKIVGNDKSEQLSFKLKYGFAIENDSGDIEDRIQSQIGEIIARTNNIFEHDLSKMPTADFKIAYDLVMNDGFSGTIEQLKIKIAELREISKSNNSFLFSFLTDDYVESIDSYKNSLSELSNYLKAVNSSEGLTGIQLEELASKYGVVTNSTEEYRNEILKLMNSSRDDILSKLQNSINDVNTSAEDKEKLLLYRDAINAMNEEAQKSPDALGDLFNSFGDKNLNNVISALGKMKTELSAIDTAYAAFKSKDDSIGLDEIVNLDAFKNLKGYNAFVATVTQSGIGAKDTQVAFNKLVTEYLYTSDILTGLTQSNKDFYIQMLQSIGIANAGEIVLDVLTRNFYSLAQAEDYAKSVGIDLANVTAIEINKLIEEKKVSEDTAKAIALYAMKKQMGNDITLMTNGDIKNMIDFCKAMGIANNSMVAYANLKKMLQDNPSLVPAFQKDLDRYAKEINEILNGGNNKNGAIPVNVDYSGGSNTQNGKDKNKSSKEFSQSIDWAEQSLKNLRTELNDLYKTLENTKPWDEQLKIQDKIIQKQKAVVNAYKKTQSAYQKQYSSSIGKLGKSKSDYKNKIESGVVFNREDFKGENGEKLYNKVKAAQDAWNNLQDINSSLLDEKYKLQDELDKKIQIRIDEYQSKIDMLDTKQNNYNSAKSKNDNLKTQLSLLKKSYKLQISLAKTEEERKKLQAELSTAIGDNSKQQFDNISAEYDNRISLISSKGDILNKKLEVLEKSGLSAGSAYYKQLITQENNSAAQQKAKLKDLNAELKDSLKNGSIKKGSDEWYEMLLEINNVQTAIDDCTIASLDFSKALDQIRLNNLDMMIDKFSSIQKESDFLIDLMSNKELIDNKGNYTSEGLATQGQHAQNYDNYMYQASQYAAELKVLDTKHKNLKLGDIGYKDYIEQRNQLLDSQQNAIKSAENEKKAIIDLCKNGIDEKINALKELVDAQKEALDAEKDLADYQAELTKKQQNAALVQKRLNAIKNDDSLETRKLRKELEKQLKEANEDLNNFQQDKNMEDQKKELDKSVESYEKSQEEYLKNTEKVFTDSLDIINKNSSAILTTLTNTASKVGYSISGDISSAWKMSGTSVSNFSTTFQNTASGMLTQLENIRKAYDEMAKAAENAANKAVNAVNNKISQPDLISPSNSSDTSKTKLNQYVTSLGQEKLSWSEMAQLGQRLGIKNATEQSVKDDASIRETILNAYKKENIQKILGKKSDGNKKNASNAETQLNQYVMGKGYDKLDYSQMTQLAKALGINGATLDSVHQGAVRNNILSELKKIPGFSTSGMVDSVLRSNNDDGFATLKKKDLIIDPRFSSDVLNMMKLTPILSDMINPLSIPTPNIKNRVDQPTQINVNAPLINVDHLDENMLRKLKYDTTIQNEVRRLTVDQVKNGTAKHF